MDVWASGHYRPQMYCGYITFGVLVKSRREMHSDILSFVVTLWPVKQQLFKLVLDS